MLGFKSLSLSYRLFYQSPWFPWSSVQDTTADQKKTKATLNLFLKNIFLVSLYRLKVYFDVTVTCGLMH